MNKFEYGYDQLAKNEFWKEFLIRVKIERQIASRHCETDEDVSTWQGKLKAYDSLESLIQEMLEDKPRKVYEPPGILSLENPK